jgi:hypothetical protein
VKKEMKKLERKAARSVAGGAADGKKDRSSIVAKKTNGNTAAAGDDDSDDDNARPFAAKQIDKPQSLDALKQSAETLKKKQMVNKLSFPYLSTSFILYRHSLK